MDTHHDGRLSFYFPFMLSSKRIARSHTHTLDMRTWDEMAEKYRQEEEDLEDLLLDLAAIRRAKKRQALAAMQKQKFQEKEEKKNADSLLQRIQWQEHRKMNPLPLAQRLGPPPIPDKLRFRKTKIINREKEYAFLFEGTAKTVGRFERLLKKNRNVKLQEGQINDIDQLLRRFYESKDSISSRCDRFTNKQWREIKRDMKRIGTVKFGDSDEEWKQACAEMAAFGTQMYFVY